MLRLALPCRWSSCWGRQRREPSWSMSENCTRRHRASLRLQCRRSWIPACLRQSWKLLLCSWQSSSGVLRLLRMLRQQGHHFRQGVSKIERSHLELKLVIQMRRFGDKGQAMRHASWVEVTPMQVHPTARPSAAAPGVHVLLLPFRSLPAPPNPDDAYNVITGDLHTFSSNTEKVCTVT